MNTLFCDFHMWFYFISHYSQWVFFLQVSIFFFWTYISLCTKFIMHRYINRYCFIIHFLIVLNLTNIQIWILFLISRILQVFDFSSLLYYFFFKYNFLSLHTNSPLRWKWHFLSTYLVKNLCKKFPHYFNFFFLYIFLKFE